ncbi:MAG TPA: PfkB family carbohydrate kinase [Candidatus Sumerlaeota bacterium]|nr:PfkB family carbohydrate kinase [Candidatus Sumerlaeota bacterium]
MPHARKRVVIVGSIALDDVHTPAGEEHRILGGAAVYGAMACSLFAPVDIVGVAGDDFPQTHIDTLTARGINLDGLQIIPGGKTFHWGGTYEGDMNEAQTRFTELGVFEHFNPTLPEPYRDNDFVFLANIDPELQLHVLDQVRRPRLVICDSMNLWINIKRDAVLEVLRRSDIALLNDGEARLLFETHSLPRAADQLLALGLARAVIKKGSHGAQMFSRDGMFAVPSIPLTDVRDPTGAGDTFAGGLIGFLASRPAIDEMAFRQALLVGSACASFVVEDFSVRRTAAITRQEVEARCRLLHEAIHCEPVRL